MHGESPYLTAYRGRFVSALRWTQLDRFWEVLVGDADGDWYIYQVGESPPEAPVSGDQLRTFVTEIDKLLRLEHQEDFCGIVYADDLEHPSFAKIYDPHNLGVVCGYSENPPLPGWTLSKFRPVDLQAAMPPPGNRRHWWQRIFG